MYRKGMLIDGRVYVHTYLFIRNFTNATYTVSGKTLTVKGANRCARDDFSVLTETLPHYHGIEQITATENLIVGCFTNDGKDEYVLVNYSDPLDLADSDVEIQFVGATQAIVYQNGQQKMVALNDGKYQTKLMGGEGAFVIPMK